MIIYCVTNRLTGKVYIGKTTKTAEHRWANHCEKAKGRPDKRQFLHKAIAKYGPENFSVEVLEEADDEHDLNGAERWWIKLYGSMAPNGYNLRDGGEGGQFSEITRKRMSEVRKGWKPPPGLHDRAAATRKARYNDERRARHSAASKGKASIHSEEHKQRLRTIWAGRSHSPETIAKMQQQARERQSTISFDQAQEIRRIYNEGEKTQDEIAAVFKTSQATVSKVIRNRLWEVPEPTPPRRRNDKRRA